jgi:enterochelin esterase-like enzyme
MLDNIHTFSVLYFYILILLVACNPVNEKEKLTSKIIKKTFFSKDLDKNVAYNVYLPKTYNTKKQFPILYLLHGHGGNENSWLDRKGGNTKKILDSLISNKIILPIVAVTMDAGNTWYVNSQLKMESAFLNEFMPLVESKFKIDIKPRSRLMAGYSMGGYGALRFALLKPELFKSVLLLSPAAYYPEPPQNSASRRIGVFRNKGVFDAKIWQSYAYPELLKTTGMQEYYPKFYLSSGDDDQFNIVKVVTDLRKFFIKNEIPQELTIINGKHAWKVWNYCFINDISRAFKIN